MNKTESVMFRDAEYGALAACHSGQHIYTVNHAILREDRDVIMSVLERYGRPTRDENGVDRWTFKDSHPAAVLSTMESEMRIRGYEDDALAERAIIRLPFSEAMKPDLPTDRAFVVHEAVETGLKRNFELVAAMLRESGKTSHPSVRIYPRPNRNDGMGRHLPFAIARIFTESKSAADVRRTVLGALSSVRENLVRVSTAEVDGKVALEIAYAPTRGMCEALLDEALPTFSGEITGGRDVVIRLSDSMDESTFSDVRDLALSCTGVTSLVHEGDVLRARIPSGFIGAYVSDKPFGDRLAWLAEMFDPWGAEVEEIGDLTEVSAPVATPNKALLREKKTGLQELRGSGALGVGEFKKTISKAQRKMVGQRMVDGRLTLNVANTPLKKARAFAEKAFAEAGLRRLDLEVKGFDHNYKALQNKMKEALDIPRIQMPVINPGRDTKAFQAALTSGHLDIMHPWAMDRIGGGKDRFPWHPEMQGGERGKEWVTLGAKDGDENDDKVKAKLTASRVTRLKPLQGEIWFDKLIGEYLQWGAPGAGSPITKTVIIISQGGYILDGHHRYGQGMLFNPALRIQTLWVPLKIKELLKVGRSYGSALGNSPKESIGEALLGEERVEFLRSGRVVASMELDDHAHAGYRRRTEDFIDEAERWAQKYRADAVRIGGEDYSVSGRKLVAVESLGEAMRSLPLGPASLLRRLSKSHLSEDMAEAALQSVNASETPQVFETFAKEVLTLLERGNFPGEATASLEVAVSDLEGEYNVERAGPKNSSWASTDMDTVVGYLTLYHGWSQAGSLGTRGVRITKGKHSIDVIRGGAKSQLVPSAFGESINEAKIKPVPRSWYSSRKGRKELAMWAGLAKQGLIDSKSAKEIMWVKRAFTFAHEMTGAGVNWWEEAANAKVELGEWLTSRNHQTPSMQGGNWVAEGIREAYGAGYGDQWALGQAHFQQSRRKVPSGKVSSYVSDRQGGFYVEYVTPREEERREKKWERDYDGYMINPDESVSEAYRPSTSWTFGKIYKHRRYEWWFVPQSHLKNGGLKGLWVDWEGYRGRKPRKVINKTLDKYDMQEPWGVYVSEGPLDDIYPKVIERFAAKGVVTEGVVGALARGAVAAAKSPVGRKIIKKVGTAVATHVAGKIAKKALSKKKESVDEGQSFSVGDRVKYSDKFLDTDKSTHPNSWYVSKEVDRALRKGGSWLTSQSMRGTITHVRGYRVSVMWDGLPVGSIGKYLTNPDTTTVDNFALALGESVNESDNPYAYGMGLANGAPGVLAKTPMAFRQAMDKLLRRQKPAQQVLGIQAAVLLMTDPGATRWDVEGLSDTLGHRIEGLMHKHNLGEAVVDPVPGPSGPGVVPPGADVVKGPYRFDMSEQERAAASNLSNAIRRADKLGVKTERYRGALGGLIRSTANESGTPSTSVKEAEAWTKVVEGEVRTAETKKRRRSGTGVRLGESIPTETRAALEKSVLAKIPKQNKLKVRGEWDIMIPNHTMIKAAKAMGADATPYQTAGSSWNGRITTVPINMLVALRAIFNGKLAKKHMAIIKKEFASQQESLDEVAPLIAAAGTAIAGAARAAASAAGTAAKTVAKTVVKSAAANVAGKVADKVAGKKDESAELYLALGEAMCEQIDSETRLLELDERQASGGFLDVLMKKAFGTNKAPAIKKGILGKLDTVSINAKHARNTGVRDEWDDTLGYLAISMSTAGEVVADVAKLTGYKRFDVKRATDKLAAEIRKVIDVKPAPHMEPALA